jgi:predicted Zn-dependent protease
VDQHRNAKQLLSSLGASCTERTFEKIDQTTQNVEIVLVPIGKVDRKLLTDVMEELQEMMGIQYSIGEGKIRLGNMDRRSDDKYLTLLVESVKNGLSKNQLKRLMSKENLSAADMKTYEGKVKFLDETFREAKVSSQDIRTFHETLDRLKGTGQYDASRLLADIRRKYPVAARSVIKGYLGITQEDIYEGNSNFLFGWARKKHGLMSYHRFTSEFNDEPPNYERVRDRTIKQAISSSFHIFGIPRCTTPTCARGYPHSLSEHDRKGIEICTWCTEQLAAYVGRNARASTD